MTESRPNDRTANSATTTRWLLLMAGTLVAVPALLPLVVGFLPRLYFETDPRHAYDPTMFTMFGPAGAVVLHTVSIACAWLAMTIAVALGGTLRKAVLLLAGVGAAAAVWQGLQHAENLATMSAWIAGVALAVAAAHVGHFVVARRWMAALVIAMLVPVGLQAGYDVLVQKPRDIAWWHANEAEVLEQRGIEAGSAQHQLLERRALSNDATGAFGFSNALGTLAAGGAVLALCVGVGGALSRRERGQPAVILALMAGGCGVSAVWFTHSTGSLGALLIGLAIAGVTALLLRTRARKVAPPLALCTLAIPIIAVLVRSVLGPPDSMAGERSLLFRFHYWEASARLFVEGMPGSAFVGVGPHGFAQGYLMHKNPLNPENVGSAHNVLVDLAAMLGLGGVAWSALVLGFLFFAGRAVYGETEKNYIPKAARNGESGKTPGVPLLRRPHVIAACTCAAVLFGTQYALQSAMMDAELALVWLAGLVGFVAVASAVGAWERLPPVALRLGLLGLAVAVLVQSQFDMAFALMATAGPAWFFVGLSGAGEDTAPNVRPRFEGIGGAVLASGVVLAVLFAVAFASPMVRHQSQLAKASRWLSIERPYEALAALEEAQAILPSDPSALRWIVALRRDEMLALASHGDKDGARRAYGLALRPIMAQYELGHVSVSTDRLHIGLLREASVVLDEPQLRDEAIKLQRALAERAPHSLQDAVTLGDMLWDRGDRAEARLAYKRALRIDEDLYLDTAMQFDPPQRERIQARLQEPDAGDS
ncbi:hypothetical protein OT109_18125 [Phycisphaeraceae bacterium D3-23]